MTYFSLLRLFTKGRWVVQKGQNHVYVNIECPLMNDTIFSSDKDCLQLKKESIIRMEQIKILHKGLVPETVYMCKMRLDMGPTSIPSILMFFRFCSENNAKIGSRNFISH